MGAGPRRYLSQQQQQLWDALLRILEQGGSRLASSEPVMQGSVARAATAERGISASRHWLVALTQEYLTNNRAEFTRILEEARQAQTASDADQPRRQLVVVNLEEVTDDPLLEQLDSDALFDLSVPWWRDLEIQRLLTTLGLHASSSKRRVALFIGIDEYPNLQPRYQLKGSVNSVELLQALLVDRFGFGDTGPRGETHIERLTNGRATRVNILKSLDRLAGVGTYEGRPLARDGDHVFLFYAGHGSQLREPPDTRDEPDGYASTLVPSDSDRPSPVGHGGPNLDITDNELYARVRRIQEQVGSTGQVVLYLDCSPSSSGTRPVETIGRTLPVDERPDAYRFVERLNPFLDHPTVPYEGRGSSGWLPLNEHCLVLSACADREQAYEYQDPASGKTFGALSFFFARELVQPKLPQTYREIFERVRVLVHARFSSQRPQLEGDGNRPLFGVEALPADPLIRVQARLDDRRVRLGVGSLQGVTLGSRWEIHPADHTQREPLATVTVREIELLSCVTESDTALPLTVNATCRAVEVKIVPQHFNIHIRPTSADGTYPMEATTPAGESGVISQDFPLDNVEFQSALRRLANLQATSDEVQVVGRRLYELLFPGPISSLFHTSRDHARSAGRPLRIQLRIDAAELDRLPWEYCYDPETQAFLALSLDTPIIRYLPNTLQSELLPVPEPLRVLAVFASPKGLTPIDTETEKQRLLASLAQLGKRATVSVLESARVNDLYTLLVQDSPHVLHYSGHSDQGALLFEDEAGDVNLVSADTLLAMLRGRDIQVVILNTSSSAFSDESEADKGMTSTLKLAGIPAVFTWQSLLADRTALLFTESLYHYLAMGQPLDRALTEARISLFGEDQTRISWGSLVLHSSTPDLVLWRRPQGAQERTSKPESVETPTVQGSTHVTTPYLLSLYPKAQAIKFGAESYLEVQLVPAADPSAPGVIYIPEEVAHIICRVRATGVRVSPADATIRVAAPAQPARFTLVGHLPGEHPYRVELVVPQPDGGSHSIVLNSEQFGKDAPVFSVSEPEESEEREPILPELDIRVAPQPDLVLEISAAPSLGSHEFVYYLTSALPTLRCRHEEVGRVRLHPDDLVRLRVLVQHYVGREALPAAEQDTQLQALGAYLWNRLFPPESAARFRERFWSVADTIQSWLFVEDGLVGRVGEQTDSRRIPWLPWELVAPSRAEMNGAAPSFFLGERYELAHWVEGLGAPMLYPEVPFRETTLAHYLPSGREHDVAAWKYLLHIPDFDGRDGLAPLADPQTPVYGLHIIQRADVVQSYDLAPRAADSQPTPSPNLSSTQLPPAASEVRRAQWELRHKRPVVTLSYLSRNGNELGFHDSLWQLPEWVGIFVRVGASALIGPWWPTSDEADARFWSVFYALLANRRPLGEAVRQARLAVQRAFPDRADWLAYALFGDPRARAYQPHESEGYVVVECLAKPPLLPDQPYPFRVRFQSEPPLDYRDRLVHTETLPQQLQAQFTSLSAAPSMSEPLEMRAIGRTMREATTTFTFPAPGTYRVIADVMEGDEVIVSARLPVTVGGQP